MTLSTYTLIFLRALVATALAMTGALIATLRTLSHRQLCALISYAAGVLLMVACFDLAPEAAARIGWLATLLGAATGYALFTLISRYVAHVCPACAATHMETVFQRITLVMIAALSVHSVLDGIAVAASIAGGHATFGVALAGAIFVHKIPEGLALTAVALGAGWPRLRAFGLTTLVEGVTTISGSWVGMHSGLSVSPVWMGWVLAHIGGGFLFLGIHATLGEFRKHPRSTVLAATLGAGTLLLLQWWSAHALRLR